MAQDEQEQPKAELVTSPQISTAVMRPDSGLQTQFNIRVSQREAAEAILLPQKREWERINAKLKREQAACQAVFDAAFSSLLGCIRQEATDRVDQVLRLSSNEPYEVKTTKRDLHAVFDQGGDRESTSLGLNPDGSVLQQTVTYEFEETRLFKGEELLSVKLCGEVCFSLERVPGFSEAAEKVKTARQDSMEAAKKCAAAHKALASFTELTSNLSARLIADALSAQGPEVAEFLRQSAASETTDAIDEAKAIIGNS